jgi:hypothetical protein
MVAIMVTQILINILIALIGGFIGMRIQRYMDNRKRKKDFYMDHYKDMWSVIQNVGGVIRRGIGKGIGDAPQNIN